MFSVAEIFEFVEGGDVGKDETVVDEIGFVVLLLVVIGEEEVVTEVVVPSGLVMDPIEGNVVSGAVGTCEVAGDAVKPYEVVTDGVEE